MIFSDTVPVVSEYSAWFDLGQKFGALVILGVLAHRLSKWLPEHLKAEGERRDRALQIFQAELAAERAACKEEINVERTRSDEQFEKVLEYANTTRTEILAAVREALKR